MLHKITCAFLLCEVKCQVSLLTFSFKKTSHFTLILHVCDLTLVPGGGEGGGGGARGELTRGHGRQQVQVAFRKLRKSGLGKSSVQLDDIRRKTRGHLFLENMIQFHPNQL